MPQMSSRRVQRQQRHEQFTRCSTGPRRANGRQTMRDACPKIGRHGDATQLGAHITKERVLEAVFTGARDAGLEMRAHALHLLRRELAVEVVIHPAKDLFARVAIQMSRHADENDGGRRSVPVARRKRRPATRNRVAGRVTSWLPPWVWPVPALSALAAASPAAARRRSTR